LNSYTNATFDNIKSNLLSTFTFDNSNWNHYYDFTSGIPSSKYTVELTKPDNPTILYPDINGTSKSITNLATGQYKWRVRASNVAGVSSYSNFRAFSINPNISNYEVNIEEIETWLLPSHAFGYTVSMLNFPSSYTYTTEWYKHDNESTFSNAISEGSGSSHSTILPMNYPENATFGTMNVYAVFKAYGRETLPIFVYSYQYQNGTSEIGELMD
jgi:hypothetical protein